MRFCKPHTKMDRPSTSVLGAFNSKPIALNGVALQFYILFCNTSISSRGIYSFNILFVHHITPYNSFEYVNEIISPYNKLSLCCELAIIINDIIL